MTELFEPIETLDYNLTLLQERLIDIDREIATYQDRLHHLQQSKHKTLKTIDQFEIALALLES
jgi:hypothetical protein